MIIITTNDLYNLDEVFKKKTIKAGLTKLIFAGFLVLFAIIAFLKLGFDFRIIFILGIAAYFLYGGSGNMKNKGNNCPKFNLKK